MTNRHITHMPSTTDEPEDNTVRAAKRRLPTPANSTSGNRYPPKGVLPPHLKGKGFQKGHPQYNPGGRMAHRVSLPDLLNRLGKEKVPYSVRYQMAKAGRKIPTWMTQWEVMARTVWYHAMSGVPFAVGFIAERVEGKVAQQVQMEAMVNQTQNVEDMTDEQLLAIATGLALPVGITEEDAPDNAEDADAGDSGADGGTGVAEEEMFQE